MGMSDLGFDINPNAMLGAVPSSFATQMAMATGGFKHPTAPRGEDEGMMGRLMLARMKSLEEGFAEVVKEFRGMRTAGNSSVEGGDHIVEKVGGGKDKGKAREKITHKKKKGSKLSRTTSEVDFANTQGYDRGDKNMVPVREDEFGGDDTQFLNRGSSL